MMSQSCIYDTAQMQCRHSHTQAVYSLLKKIQLRNVTAVSFASLASETLVSIYEWEALPFEHF